MVDRYYGKYLSDHPEIISAVGIGISIGIFASIGFSKKKKTASNYPDLSLVSRDRSLLHEKYSPSKVPDDIDVIVIGSGMSGLSCAAVLSRLGRKVLVVEQHHDVAGGGTHSFDIKGYHFDSGLHYTVPWSIPIFALTCGKKPKDVCQFKIMGEGDDDIVDKINLFTSENESQLFCMRYKEKHFPELYRTFPSEKVAIDKFIELSNNAMDFVKIFIALRLLPLGLQRFAWKYLIPSKYVEVAACTASELLPKLTKNKKLISLLSSMWIDTGARPDRASFMLTASVFRGVSMEGGCYPQGGAETMAKELVPVIQSHGGKVLIRAPVREISVNPTSGRVEGVVMNDASGTFIPCKEAVVSSAGYFNTYHRLLQDERTKDKFAIPKAIGVGQSAGFVMCNIGIAADAKDIDATNTNTWHIPTNEDGDAFEPLARFFEEPLVGSAVKNMPVFITFPSLKDREWSSKHPGKTSCQMLVMAEYAWFEPYRGQTDEERLFGYESLKQAWLDRCLEVFYLYFPKSKGKVEVADLSTPLSIEHYLRAHRGAAVGIDVTPERFTDPAIRDQLDVASPIPGLYLTGQDTVLCGVTLCQLAGVITAFRMAGPWAALKVLVHSIMLGD